MPKNDSQPQDQPADAAPSAPEAQPVEAQPEPAAQPAAPDAQPSAAADLQVRYASSGRGRDYERGGDEVAFTTSGWPMAEAWKAREKAFVNAGKPIAAS